MTEQEIIEAVRWRYRTCHYLFRLGAIWILTGAVVGLFFIRYEWWGWLRNTVELIRLGGLGIFTSAFALTLAIYRCPVCDHHLSKFWPYKERCAHCGAKVRWPFQSHEDNLLVNALRDGLGLWYGLGSWAEL